MKRKLGIYAFPIALLISVAPAVCVSQSVLTHHVREATQDGSAPRMGAVLGTGKMNLVLTLPLRNQDQLDQLLIDLYNPSSPSYRHFLTVEQFTEQFAPT